MTKSVSNFQLIDNKRIKKDFFVLELLSEQPLPEILPGQFVQVRVNESRETFLRRPFSVHDVDYNRNSLKLLIQIAGKGTSVLAEMKTGEIISLVFPLGNSFSLPESNDRTLLVGGGCGVAPLLFLAKYLKSHSRNFDILMGFRNKDRIIEYEEYGKLSKVFITTEDGSEGEKGFVTQHSILGNEKYSRIYCCGPDAMMKSVGKFALANEIHCEVSLENLMGCGFGVCLCCVVNTVDGNVCSCTEGPVFNIKRLKW
jgi:dihydroorotate dehydrogenase electron transfer subunit